MASAAANLVKALVQKNNVAVFSKSYCPFCKLAKDVLTKAGASEKAVMELDLRSDGDDLQNELKLMTGQSTVPHVFIKQKFVGGGDDVKMLYESGELQKMVS